MQAKKQAVRNLLGAFFSSVGLVMIRLPGVRDSAERASLKVAYACTRVSAFEIGHGYSAGTTTGIFLVGVRVSPAFISSRRAPRLDVRQGVTLLQAKYGVRIIRI